MSDNMPFGAPPASFVQTGNQITVGESPFNDTGSALENAPFGTPTSGPDPFGNTSVDPFSGQMNGSAPSFQPATHQEKQKYQIMDLFWILTPKYGKSQPAQGEAHFVIISYNISFGNLRISYFDLTQTSIQKNIAFLENFKRTVSGTIYPATAFNISKSIRVTTTCLEQLFKQIPGANWQLERPICVVEKNEELIRFTVKDPKFGTFSYDFTGWQREAFLHACEFCYTEGFKLMGQNLLK